MKPETGVLKNKTDVKIFILFLLCNVQYPLPYSEVCDVILEDGYIANFDFAECFSELCDLGHILEEDGAEEKYYRISPTGMMAAAELQNSILESIRKKSLHSAMRYLSLRRRGAEATVKTRQREDNQYTVTCTLSETAGVLVSYSLTVPSEAQARRIGDHFKESPEDVARAITAAATGELAYLMGAGEAQKQRKKN